MFCHTKLRWTIVEISSYYVKGCYRPQSILIQLKSDKSVFLIIHLWLLVKCCQIVEFRVRANQICQWIILVWQFIKKFNQIKLGETKVRVQY